MAALAEYPQVCCKFSGLMGAAPEQLRAVWGDLLRWFGPRRLMWGSDWPVLTLDASYADAVARSAALIAELPADEQARLWQGTAAEFYGLGEVMA
jgi:L-fuconolactonase